MKDARVKPLLESLDLRSAVADDDARIVAIYNLHPHAGPPLTVARYRAEYLEESTGSKGERFVATTADSLIGFASFRWAWWTADPNIYSVNICVDPEYLRRGVGTKLFERIQSRLRLREAARLVGWVPVDTDEGRGFASHLGLQETGQIIQEYLLPIAEADTSAYPALELRLQGYGLRIAPLSELPQDDPTFLHALQRLWADCGEETLSERQLTESFDSWRQQVLHAPGGSPETHWIALEGERPVGMTFLKRLGADAFENDYTAVADTYRGRGIATALKLRSILWAQQHGVKWFCTSSEIDNAAMIAINTRLGYRPGVRLIEVACHLTP